MSSIINEVYNSLKWKRSDRYCSNKLKMSLEQYKEIKKQILNRKKLLKDEFDGKLISAVSDNTNNDLRKNKIVEWRENIDNGTAEIKGIAFSEPKTPEEIIDILKIDTDKWKLSSYWNKQHRDHWLISAMVTQKTVEQKDLIKEILENFNPSYTPIEKVYLNEKFTPSLGILSIQDLHFGKDGNSEVGNNFYKAVQNVIMRAYKSHNLEKIVYVFGGDLLNMDTFYGQTTKGTIVNNDSNAQDTYNKAFDSLYWSVNFIKQFCKQLHLIYLPGNHDRLSSYHIAHALFKCFKEDKNIIFDVEYSERKVITYGNNFFAFEHGDISSKNTPLLYATEFHKEWGNTIFRTCYTGHWHRKKTTEYISENEIHGFSIKNLPSLSKSDYWHYHNKFTGEKRQIIMEIHDKEIGKISEFTYNV